MSEHPFLTLLLIAAFVAIIPPRWDPAIRIKEWQKRRWREPW